MNNDKIHYIITILLCIILYSCVGSNNRLGYESEECDTAVAASEFSPDSDRDTYVSEKYKSLPTSNLTEIYTDNRMSILYPSSWEIVHKNAKIAANTTIAVQIMEKRRNDYDFCPNVNVIFSREKRTESTSNLAMLSYKQANEAGYATNLIDIKDCKISGCKGSLAEFTASIEGYDLHIYQYIIKKIDNTTIIITVTLDQGKLKKQLITAKEILNSVTIY
ncbi:MAG: hypothetical protein NC453_29145 [Muribaculum sp.]|nr:hypothetical protein [Muribaculum sp.]